ncbi:nucleoside-diphosphate sugar epimerase/dehydratase [Peptoanaerobacter stomatis]|uniref:nucleoside-diphosphate sugar epimerase/dehydratase n=1 Tax=Peptoanaerobacter stomatis TaxID=796937 RepID=UPI003FA0852D
MFNGIYDEKQFAYLYDMTKKWLELKMKGKSLGNILSFNNIKNVFIYGINGFGELTYDDIKDSNVKINAFIDKRADEYINGYKGIDVLFPDSDLNKFEDYIIVTPEYYFNEILNDLVKNGVSIDRIISLSMILES